MSDFTADHDAALPLWPKKCFVWYFKMKNAARFVAAATR
jgi:hypothetical protein